MYEMSQDWESLLYCINNCKDQLKDEERQALVNKYIPLALNSLYQMLSSKSNISESKKIQDMKIRMKYEKDTRQILEEDEYGQEMESSDKDDEEDEDK